MTMESIHPQCVHAMDTVENNQGWRLHSGYSVPESQKIWMPRCHTTNSHNYVLKLSKSRGAKENATNWKTSAFLMCLVIYYVTESLWRIIAKIKMSPKHLKSTQPICRHCWPRPVGNWTKTAHVLLCRQRRKKKTKTGAKTTTQPTWARSHTVC